MADSKIDYHEQVSGEFSPLDHFSIRIQEMGNESNYGGRVASKWDEIVNKILNDEAYPVEHPIGQETFSLYAEFPSGVFEYALDIDGATSLINKKSIMPDIFMPSKIIHSVDEGNINKDTSNIKTNHKNPVMVLQSQYLTEGKPYCINGNHRIFEAHRNNKDQIEVYLFKELEFVPFFYDILSKAMYYFEIDYSNVINNQRNYLKGEQDAFAYIFKDIWKK